MPHVLLEPQGHATTLAPIPETTEGPEALRLPADTIRAIDRIGRPRDDIEAVAIDPRHHHPRILLAIRVPIGMMNREAIMMIHEDTTLHMVIKRFLFLCRSPSLETFFCLLLVLGCSP